MARGVRLKGERAWLALGGALLLPAWLLGLAPPAWQEALAWRPELAWREPWRAISAAWVHLSGLHLAANTVGAVLVAALGLVVGVGRRAAWALSLAWPLTHLSLLWQPDVLRYGGLSGVLHAGAAVIAVHLAAGAHALPNRALARGLGLALAGGLLVKVMLERPWGAALQPSADWGFALVPLAHAAGAAWGLLLGAAGLVGRGRRPQ